MTLELAVEGMGIEWGEGGSPTLTERGLCGLKRLVDTMGHSVERMERLCSGESLEG